VSHYVHHIPGRLRVRSAAVKRNEGNASAVRALLASVPGVRSSEVNTLTGSIVVHYDPAETSGPAVTAVLRDRGYFLHPVLPQSPVNVLRAAPRNGDLGSRFAKKLATYALETALERSVVVLVGALL
jgi:copper chaperone CopZ